MTTQKKPLKHNAETVRLAKLIPFTAKELYVNQSGQLTKEQISELNKEFWTRFVFAFGTLIIMIIIAILVATDVIELSSFNLSARMSRRVIAYGLITLVLGGLACIWASVKAVMGILAVKGAKIRSYKGFIEFSEQTAKGQTSYYMHMGKLKWHIKAEYYRVFQAGYEYTVYYLAGTDAILSVEASDPNFYKNSAQ